jgi:transketolase
MFDKAGELEGVMGMKLESTRDAYGETLVELARADERIVALSADLTVSTRLHWFARSFPERFFDFGIAEANMISTAAGFASCGKIAFASTFAVFATCRVFDQLRMSIAYPRLNVKVVASHGGISVGEDGASHHAIEDLALMCSLPNFTVIAPADARATRELVRKAAYYEGPVYIRLNRPKVPVVYEKEEDFEIGRAKSLAEGEDIAIIANGMMVYQALEAARMLANEGISASVLDVHTLKPLDEEAIVKAAEETGAVVTAEEHLLHGGLGSAVSLVLAEKCPVPMRFVAIRDTYCKSGKPWELFLKYGLTAEGIAASCMDVVAMKRHEI